MTTDTAAAYRFLYTGDHETIIYAALKKLHLRPTIACVPDNQMGDAEDAGWVCWDETLLLSPSNTVGVNTFASNVLRQLSGRTRATYLTLEGGDNSARVLSALLRRLESEQFMVSVPMETRL